MKKIDFLAQNGCGGETTLAVHAAMATTEAGDRLVIIDHDPQQSATVFGNARTSASPLVVTAAVSELSHVLKAATRST